MKSCKKKFLNEFSTAAVELFHAINELGRKQN